RQQKRHAEHGAAGIGCQRAGTLRIKEFIDAREQRLRPHGGIFCGRVGVEENGVWFGALGSTRLLNERRKVAEFGSPSDICGSVLKSDGAITTQFAKRLFVAEQVAQRGGVIEREAEGFGSSVKA